MKQLFEMFFMQMQHLHKMFFYFLAAAAVTFVFGLGVSVSAGVAAVLGAALAATLVSAGALAGGVGLTIALRSLFGLMQIGRILQYAAFWLAAAVSLKLVGLVFASPVVHSALLAGFTIFAIAFTAAIITGEVPTKGRSWLPVKMPVRK